MQLLFTELRGRNSELCIASKLAEITLLNEIYLKFINSLKMCVYLEGSYVNVESELRKSYEISKSKCF